MNPSIYFQHEFFFFCAYFLSVKPSGFFYRPK